MALLKNKNINSVCYSGNVSLNNNGQVLTYKEILVNAVSTFSWVSDRQPTVKAGRGSLDRRQSNTLCEGSAQQYKSLCLKPTKSCCFSWI